MMKFLSWGGCLLTFCVQCQIVPVFAQEPMPPEPLTLKYALSQVNSAQSPEMMSYLAKQQMAQAQYQLSRSEMGLFAELNTRLQYIEPSSVQTNRSRNDSRLSLDISKRVYDFGYSHANIEASQKRLDSVDVLHADYTARRTVAILQAYIEVILSDLSASHANEAMAIDFVQLDKLRSRFELKQISDIELLAMETQYRKTRRSWEQAQSQQRITRQQLAQLISPGQLSDQVELPDFKQLRQLSAVRELPEIDQLYQLAHKQNPNLRAKQYELAAASAQLKAHRAEKYPVISAHLQAADYARELGGSDRFRAAIQLKVPIYQAGQENARIKLAQAKKLELEAQTIQLTWAVKQQITTLWLTIENLKKQIQDAQTAMDYRELYLDRSRALYELEVTSDLGDAMVQLSKAQIFQLQSQFELAISWAKMDALLGNDMNYFE